MLLENFRVRQGVEYCAKDIYRTNQVYRGIILEVTDEEIVVIEVHYGDNYICCYDDKDAEYPRDAYNVRLKDSPPPFVDFSDGMRGYTYVVTKSEYVRTFTAKQCEECRVQILDNGECISERDWNEIWNHMSKQQLEKEKVFRELPKVADQLDDGMVVSKNSGREFGYD